MRPLFSTPLLCSVLRIPLSRFQHACFFFFNHCISLILCRTAELTCACACVTGMNSSSVAGPALPLDIKATHTLLPRASLPLPSSLLRWVHGLKAVSQMKIDKITQTWHEQPVNVCGVVRWIFCGFYILIGTFYFSLSSTLCHFAAVISFVGFLQHVQCFQAQNIVQQCFLHRRFCVCWGIVE